MKSSVQRVLFVLHTPAIGGMETLCVDVASEFVRRGIETDVLLPEDPLFEPLDARFRAGGVGVKRLTTDFHTDRWSQSKRLARFVRFVRERRPDVIHLHTGGTAGGLAVLALARAVTSATIVCTEHDVSLSPRPTLTSFDSQSYHWVMRTALDRVCHGLMAVSRRNANLRREWLDPGRDKFAVVLNGIPVKRVPEDERVRTRAEVLGKLGIDPGATVVGTLCRLAPRKGLDDLVRAFALVRARSECELVLVGDGPLGDELRRLVNELGVEKSVHFAGYHANPAPFLQAFDAFVLAVPEGSMSIALLEAMGQGLACVITFCGPEEAIVPEKTGLCAPPRNPAGLAEAIGRLVDDPALRARLGATAAEYVARRFSIARVADDWLEVYATCRTSLPARLRADSPPEPRVV